MADKSVFETLNSINVNENTKKKNNLTYLPWAWAWGEVKKRYPLATYRIYENDMGMNYHTDGRTCWVKVSVTIEDLENIEYLPVMDYRNCSIPIDKITSVDVTKAIQRGLTKACARHGLGLYIYAGEDLPEEAAEVKPTRAAKKTAAAKAPVETVAPEPAPEPFPIEETCMCSKCKKPIVTVGRYTADMLISKTKERYGMPYCYECLLEGSKKAQEGQNNAE